MVCDGVTEGEDLEGLRDQLLVVEPSALLLEGLEPGRVDKV